MKLLLLAYHFPPMGGAGVQRALKFSRYLGECGVQVTVLAGHDPAYTADASLVDEIPASVGVHRVEHQPLLQRVVAWRARRRPAGALATVPHTPPSTPPGGLRDAALAVYASLQFPDDKAGWARRAFETACRLVREEGVQLILSSAPPVSSHALAARLSRACGVPWVADWRDLWTGNPAYAALAWRRPIDRRLERRWLDSAAGVVTVTPTLQRALAAQVAGRCPVVLIPNGYDEADFATVEPVLHADAAFRVVHAGTLYGHQSPRPVLAAAESLLARHPALAARLRLRFVGLIGTRFEPLLTDFAARNPGVLERTGFVGHRRAVAEMLGADLLLLLIGGGAAARGVLSGKIFEYLRARRPVLLVGPPEGDAAQLLRAHAPCRVAAEEDVAGIAEALKASLAGDLPAQPTSASPETFERRALTQQLDVFLQRCLERTPGRRDG
ncbi:MAG: glycosyltransferase [Piscinibacter sp.]|nr:glycosyltransferase [Piscinibacter sp.]